MIAYKENQLCILEKSGIFGQAKGFIELDLLRGRTADGRQSFTLIASPLHESRI